jgi:hypothetical protein
MIKIPVNLNELLLWLAENSSVQLFERVVTLVVEKNAQTLLNSIWHFEACKN